MKVTQLYDNVTQSIIKDLEAGVPSWTKPWRTPVTQLGTLMPHNYATRHANNGIKVAILWMAKDAKSYPTSPWLTFRQAAYLGGTVRAVRKALASSFDAAVNIARSSDFRSSIQF